jgi:hypothetical protein
MTKASWKWHAKLGGVLAAILGIGAANEAVATQSAGTIYADPSAAGPVLQLLSQDYQIADLATLPASFAFTPVVIGPAALDNPAIMALVIHAYQAGFTVAIVQATQAQTNEFEGLVTNGQVASCRPVAGSSMIAFYGLRHPLRQPAEESRYCLPDLVDRPGRGKQREQEWLQERFAATPQPLPEATSLTPGDSLNLDSLSARIHCSALVRDPQDYAQIQQDIYVTSLRSFNQSQDYILVNSYPKFFPYKGSSFFFEVQVNRPFPSDGGLADLEGTRLVFTEPDTITSYVSQYTKSKSETISGGGGFSVAVPPSFDVQASYSVTAGSQTTTTIPPVTILNRANLIAANLNWQFQPANATHALYSTTTSHLWTIPRSVYAHVYPNGEPSGELLFTFRSFMQITSAFKQVDLNGQCAFYAPFPSWTVTNPQITEVDPTRVHRGGGTFLIVGSQLYPSIVSSVLLGGDPLPAPNVVPLDDSHVKVVVPSGAKVGLTPVQVNTFFNGSTLPSNSNVQVDIRP